MNKDIFWSKNHLKPISNCFKVSTFLFVISFTFICLFFLLLPSNLRAADYYVDPTNGNDIWDGSEDYPWKTITHGLSIVVDEDNIFCLPGLYWEESNGEKFPLLVEKDIHLIAFDSGFGNAVLTGQVKFEKSDQNNQVKIPPKKKKKLVSSSPSIKGFTIYGGISCWNSELTVEGNNIFGNYGNGIYCQNCQITIQGNIINDNLALKTGGGIYCNQSTGSIENNIISGNWGAQGGGGLYSENSTLKVNKNIFDSNFTGIDYQFNQKGLGEKSSLIYYLRSYTLEPPSYATYPGGGICIINSDTQVAENSFFENVASGSGGGIYFENSTSTAGPILGNTFNGNIAGGPIVEDYGGGIYCRDASPNIEQNTFINNSNAVTCNNSSPNFVQNLITQNGGIGICCLDDSHPVISECLIEYCETGIYCYYSSPVIEKNIIRGHLQAYNYYDGAIYCEEYSSPSIIGNVISQNDMSGIYLDDNCSPTIIDNFLAENQNGGIYINHECSPLICNNSILKNRAGEEGGGIYCGWDTSPLIIDNFISENLVGDGGYHDPFGGGIYCTSSTPIIVENVITKNLSYTSSEYDTGYGGGISCKHESTPIIVNNIISENTAEDGGGGIFTTDDSKPLILLNNISKNTAYIGGGIYSILSFPSLFGNQISRNTATFAGAGVYSLSSVASIKNNTILYNRAEFQGGGIYCQYSYIDIIGNNISNNSALNDAGGGIFSFQNPAQVITENSLIQNNAGLKANSFYIISTEESNSEKLILENNFFVGGWGSDTDIDIWLSSLTMKNCLIAPENAATAIDIKSIALYPSYLNFENLTITRTSSSGINATLGSEITIANSIIWNQEGISLAGDGNYHVYFSDLTLDSTWCNQEGNICQDPLFVNAFSSNLFSYNEGISSVTSDQFYLSQISSGQAQNSPCVDAGYGTAEYWGLENFTTRTDLVPDQGTVDMGFHYYFLNFPPYPPTLLGPSNGATISCDITFTWINNGDPDEDDVGSWLYAEGPEGQFISQDIGIYGHTVGEELNYSITLTPNQEWFWTIYIWDTLSLSEPNYNCQRPFWKFYTSSEEKNLLP